ncbi:hypothetical protein [Curtobacterium sp. MCBD17_032]|uniref:hypothetical protein n=1 Tax=Curtobacterium sp. MCBD17_032 TaxID=2175659 RepID=UPI0015E8782C|nr:hypothetical protein [Curtobacterium sp. MCBD17_032]
MSSTPLFDAIARRTAEVGRTRTAGRETARATSNSPAVPVPVAVDLAAPSTHTTGIDARGTGSGLGVPADGSVAAGASTVDAPAYPAAAPTTPTSPVGSAGSAAPTAAVPADLIAVIDDIPASLRASLAREYAVGRNELPLVEAVVDAVTKAVVDAVAVEVDRIITSGVIRS